MGTSNSILTLLLLIIITATTSSGFGTCNVNQCDGVGTCCCFNSDCSENGCCPHPNGICCDDGHHCCPSDHPVCQPQTGRCFWSSRSIFGIPANELQPAKRIMSREKIEETLVEFAETV